MPALVKTILPPVSVEWKWPLLVGLPPGSPFQPAILQQIYWARQLSRVSRISPSARGARYNMILFRSAPEAVNTIRRMTDGKLFIKADVLLIKTDAAFFSHPAPGQNLENAVKMLARYTGAAGVIFFHTPLPDQQWYNELVMQISHDLSLTKAIANIPNSQSWSFVSPSLELATRLSTIVSRLSDDLAKGKYIVTRPVNYQRPNFNTIITKSHTDLSRFLKEDFPHLDYSGESKTGTQLLRINQSLKLKNVTATKPAISKPMIGVKRMFPLKGGGLEILTNWPAQGGGTSAEPVIIKEKKSAKPPNRFTGNESSSGGIVPKKKAAKPPKKKAAKPNPAFIAPNRKPGIKNGGGHGFNPFTESHKPKKKAAKPPKKKAAKPAKTGAETPQDRYLQAAVSSKKDSQPITDHLLPEKKYMLRVYIGVKNEAYSNTGVSIEPGLAVSFKEAKTKSLPVTIQVKCNTIKKQLTGKLTVPRTGDSKEAIFTIPTGKKEKILEAEIFAFYKQRLLQKAVLRIDIRKPEEPAVLKTISMRTEAVLDNSLSNPEERIPVHTSVIEPKENDNTRKANGISGNKPLGFKFSDGLTLVTQKIKGFIEQVVTDETLSEAKLTDETSVTLLRQLASQGSILYSRHIKQDLNGLLQIVSMKEEYALLEFVYSYPAPYRDAGLCKNFVAALKEGACKKCDKENHGGHGHICPFGFWGLRQVIERHRYGVKEDNPEQFEYLLKLNPVTTSKPLRVLNRTQFAESERVDNSNTGVIKKVDEAIKKNSNTPLKVTNWTKWRESVQKNDPDCFILLVHMEDDQQAGVDSMEIGDLVKDKDALLPITLIDAGLIKKDEHSTTMPLVVLIGCETANLASYGFGAPDFLIETGSAIVLSNFTRIRGKHAGEIVVRLVELLKQHAKNEARFGEVVLKLKQQLLAEGNLVSLTLLAHGDADWKIKT